MNLKQLEVFIAVAESGSFSRAAEITFLTQSTVSQHVSSLESEFDLKLLDRTGKVGGSNIPACYMIPECIPSFQEQHPGVMVSLFQGDSSETLERLKREEVEFVLVGTRFTEKGFIHRPLTLDTISLVVPAGHPWAGRDYILPENLLDEPLIFREPGSGTDRAFRDQLVKMGFAPDQLKVSMQLGSNEAVKQAILNHAGISFLSELSVKKECERGELFVVNVKGVAIFRHFYLITHQGRELSPAAEAFCACILGHFHAE